MEATDFANISRLNISKDDTVINCIGITNKKQAPDELFYVVNSLFPRILADYCERHGANMIHITTDCVYDGKMIGSYWEFDNKNATDIYGLSKALGEPRNCTCIRTSIIGENRNSSADLLEWVRSNAGGIINGWINHYWNGITCLQFAEICEKIIQDNLFWHGTRHIHSPKAVSKYELVHMINEIYELGITINPIAAPVECNRVLSSCSKPMFIIPSIREQIEKQKAFII